jgi:uncharacterized protein
MNENTTGGPEWPIDIRYGLACFCILAALELLIAAGARLLGAQSERAGYLITTAARVLDALLIFYFLRRKGLGLSALGLSRRLWKKGVVHGLAWGGLCAVAGALVFWRPLLEHFRKFSFHPELYDISILSFVVGVIIGPAVEELVFRGWLYGALRNRFHPVSSVLMSALVFSLAHGLHPRRFLLGFLGGLLFGVSYEVSRSLVAPLMLHIGGNAVLHIVMPMLAA